MNSVIRIDDLIKSSDAKEFSGVMVIGDVHGNYEKFNELVKIAKSKNLFIVSTGDIIDYGFENVKSIKLMSKLFVERNGMMVLGNHESKFIRYMKQYKDGKILVQIKGGIVQTVEETNKLSDIDRKSLFFMFEWMLDRTPLVAKFGNVTVTHGAVHRSVHNIEYNGLGGFARNFALFGEVEQEAKGSKPKKRFPKRMYNWVNDIPENQIVVVGHAILGETPVLKENDKGGKAYFIDTGSSKFVDDEETIEGKLSAVVLTQNEQGLYFVEEIITI